MRIADAKAERNKIMKEDGGPHGFWRNPKRRVVFSLILDQAERYGKYSYDYYSLTAEQYRHYNGLEDLKKAKALHETGIYFSNHWPWAVTGYKGYLDEVLKHVGFLKESGWLEERKGQVESIDEIMEELNCPYFRVVRLLEAVCPNDTTDQGCLHFKQYGGREVHLELSGLCPKMAFSPIQDLAFDLPD